MDEMLLCTHNPMLAKSLYGVIRDRGYNVEVTDHPAHAVQMTMKKKYQVVIMDSGVFGLSAEEASQIIIRVSPGIRIVLVGCSELETDTSIIRVPADTEILGNLLNTISL